MAFPPLNPTPEDIPPPPDIEPTDVPPPGEDSFQFPPDPEPIVPDDPGTMPEDLPRPA